MDFVLLSDFWFCFLFFSAFRQSVPGNCLRQIRYPSFAPLCLRLPTRQTWRTCDGGIHAQHGSAARQQHRSAGCSPKGTHTHTHTQGVHVTHFIICQIIDIDENMAGTVSSLLILFGPLQSMRLRLQPPSGTELAAFNPILPPAAITQVILLANPLKVLESVFHRFSH